MPVSNASLSFVPNVRIAQRFTGSGVNRIIRFPTAIAGAASGRTNAATTSPTPRASPAETSPIAAPRGRVVRRDITAEIRRLHFDDVESEVIV